METGGKALRFEVGMLRILLRRSVVLLIARRAAHQRGDGKAHDEPTRDDFDRHSQQMRIIRAALSMERVPARKRGNLLDDSAVDFVLRLLALPKIGRTKT